MAPSFRHALIAFTVTCAAAVTVKAQQPVLAISSAGITGISDTVNLISFNTNTPGTWTTVGPLTGMLPGHFVRTIDWRPSNGVVYAMSTNSTMPSETQLYTVNQSTGALATVGSPFTIAGNNNRAIEMDFNPVTDELRVVTRFGQNIRVNPATGAIASTDSTLAYVAGDPSNLTPDVIDVVAIAHRNDGTLFGWEWNNDAHIRIGGPAGTPPASNGELTSIFIPPAFLTMNSAVSMDVSTTTNTLYISRDTDANGTSQSFFTRDMATGAETLIGAFGSGNTIMDFTIVPEPGSMIAGTAAVVAVGGWIRRRRKQAVAAPITTA